MSEYVYINSEPRLYTVGFYLPGGKWHPESDHTDREDAAQRVALLNGDCDLHVEISRLQAENERLKEELDRAAIKAMEDSLLLSDAEQRVVRDIVLMADKKSGFAHFARALREKYHIED